MVALTAALHNGQVVEIITQKNAKPSQDWLKIAKTNQALNKIRQWLSKNPGIGETTKETEEIKKEPPKADQPIKTATRQIILTPVAEVTGDSKISTVLAKCCRPQPPDEIMGYITLHQRLTVHKRDCKSLAKVKDQKRLVSVNWKTN